MNSTQRARHIAVLTLALGAVAAPAYASDQTITTPDLLITAGAQPLPTKEVASSYTIISQQDIKRFQYRTIVDALKQVPGLSVIQLGGAGAQTSVFMRGTNSNETLVLLNGQPISDPSSPSGAFNFANLMLDNVERIEVVRGPQSALYGSQAIGGVINIITKKASDTPKTTLRLEAGTLGTLNTGVSTTGSAGGVSYFASLNREATDGNDIMAARYRGGAPVEKDGYENVSGSAQFSGKLNEYLNASTFMQYGSSRADTDDDFPGAGLTSQSRAKQFSLQGNIDGTFMDGRYKPKLSIAYLQYKRHDNNTPDPYSVTNSLSDNRSQRISVTFDNSYQITRWNLANLGVDYSHESFDTNGFFTTTGYSSTSNSSASSSSVAFYGSDHIELENGLFATVSGRYDAPQGFSNQFTYSIAPGYFIDATDTRITASYGTAFKAPALYERFGYSASNFGTYLGNPNLKPEKSRGWEVGFDQGLFDGLATFGATYFKNHIENAISSDAFNTTSINNPAFNTYGVESYVQVEPIASVSARIDYTYTMFDLQAGANPLLRRPRHIVNGTLGWDATDKLHFGSTLQWVANYKDVRNVAPYDNFTMRPYTVVNFSASYQLTENVELTARINNLLDRHYEIADGFTAPGIEALAGVALSF